MATDTDDDLDSDLSSLGGSPSDREIFAYLNKKSTSLLGSSQGKPASNAGNVELLKEELLTKNAMIEKLKNEHMVIVTQLEERCAELLHQSTITKLQSEKDIKQCELYFRQQQEKTQHELEILKVRLKDMEQQNPILRERLSAAKEDLAGTLTISEGTYVELKAKPVDSLTLREYVMLRIYETEKGTRVQRDGAVKENEINNTRLVEAREGFARLNRDYELLARTTNERIHQLEDDLQIERSKTSKLHKQLTEYVGKVEVLEVKGTSYDKLNEELQAVQSELSRVTHDHITSTHTLKVVQEDKTETSRKLTESSQTVELLRMDKIYLSKEVENLQHQIRKLEDQSERQQQKLRDTKKSREELFQKLIKYKEEQKTTYEERLGNEVENLREKTLEDLEAIKASAKEQADRELRSMRETRDNAVLESDRARAKLSEVRQAYDELQAEHRTVVASFEGKLAEMHAAMKMKVFELERLALTYEETLNNLSQARVEIEKFRKKAELLTTEYYTLQTESTKRISELSAKIDELSEKLMGFEGLEAELESAAMSGDIPNLASSSLPVRKTRQLLQLSRRIAELERNNKEMSSQLLQEQDKSTKLSFSLSRTGDLLKQTSQPHNYLVETIEQRDTQLDSCQRLIDHLENELENQKQDCAELTRQKNALEAQCRQLLGQESKVLALRRMVEQMQARTISSSSFSISQPHDPAPTEINSAPMWYQKLKPKS